MELNREHFRSIIYYNFQRQLSQQECLTKLLSVFGNEARHQSTISRWYGEFKRGRVSLSDDPRVATFVSKAGHIAKIPLNEQRTVTADWYTTICLPKVIIELRKIILHQDNASPYTAQKTRQYLTEENVELLEHPPYSPDLSPNDFFTFPKIKNRLRGQRFQSPEEAVDAFKNAVLDLPANEWNKCFLNWFERMQMCINRHTNKYLSILEESLLPVMEECLTSGQDFVFQQDGAACHTSKKVIKWMEENNVPLLKWVSSSPDLSPIETLWHEMKKP
ncbi:unnamed protein product [Acanthoscelides obtectus]|uniref:Mos1 transposase HTH domain-containing protein n=1 Tax=Acanthoscelides obtectus TaxID=200917 RepID=A0A9P0KB84_ACAOB|nr:unnamed protein product [Acanthoscelides obtectus]CAK1628446.1 Histone-lysine N-methyltransferase SETMAR [Acanthoscelides obtectus]